MRIDELPEHARRFQADLLRDILLEATAFYWNRRADQFEAVGNARCDEIARACRHKAKLSLGGDLLVEGIICPTCGTPTSPWSCSCGLTRLEAVA